MIYKMLKPNNNAITFCEVNEVINRSCRHQKCLNYWLTRNKPCPNCGLLIEPNQSFLITEKGREHTQCQDGKMEIDEIYSN